MKLNSILIRSLLDQLEAEVEAEGKLSLLTTVWGRFVGPPVGEVKEVKICRSQPALGGEEGEWCSLGCLEAILRRGTEV